MGLIVAGAASTGGLTALAVKWSRKRNNAKEIPNPNSTANERGNENESSNEDVHQNRR